MKIADIRAHVMNVPAADGRTPRRNWVFVEVETSLKPRLQGMDPMDVEHVWQLGYRDFWWKRGVVHTSAVSGIDMALWDVVGKATGQPVFRLLGGRVRDRVRCYARADLGLDSLEAHAAAAMQNFEILEHCRLRPWFDDVQTTGVPLSGGCVDVEELGRRPGLGVELDMELVKSRPYQALPPRRYEGPDGAIHLY